MFVCQQKIDAKASNERCLVVMTDIPAWFNAIPSSMYGLFIGLSAFIENVFPPYPGDTVIVFGGYLLSSNRISLWELVFVIYAGNLLSASLMYYFGERVLLYFRKFAYFSWAKEMLDPANLQKTEAWFNKWGFLAVLVSRFSAGIRFFVAIVAGITHMPFWLFLLGFFLATTLWNTLLVYGGWLLGEKWEKMLEILPMYNIFVIAILVLLVTAWFAWRWRARKQSRSNEK